MSLSRAVRSLAMFQSGRNATRPAVGSSRSSLAPPQARRAASIEPYFALSQSPNWPSTILSSGSGMFFASNVQKKYESSLMISRPMTAGSSTSRLPVVGLGVWRRAYPVHVPGTGSAKSLLK